MPPPSNVTRTGISLLPRVSISFLLLPPVLSPFSSSPLSSDDERHQRLRIDIYTSRNRPSTEQLPEQPRAHEAATLSRGDPLWKKSLFSSLHVTLRVACLPLRRTMVVGNNHERSKPKRLRTTSITPFFFSLRFADDVDRDRWTYGISRINEFSPRFSFKEACSSFFFQYDFFHLCF